MKTGFPSIGMQRVVDELVLLQQRLNSIDEHVFLMAGTLLGIIRDGRLIDHDKDVDLGIMSEKSIMHIYSEFGHLYDEASITDIPCGKILWLQRYFDGQYALPFEIQCFYYHDKDRVFYNRHMDKGWKCEETHVEYPSTLFKKFSDIDFAGEKFLSPSPPEIFLNVFYGNNWRWPKKYSDWRPNCPALYDRYLTERTQ